MFVLLLSFDNNILILAIYGYVIMHNMKVIIKSYLLNHISHNCIIGETLISK